MTKNPERHLAEITAGLQAVKDAKMSLNELGFDTSTLHDLEQAIANNALPHFVEFMEGKGELTEVLNVMRGIRELVASMPE